MNKQQEIVKKRMAMGVEVKGGVPYSKSMNQAPLSVAA